MKIVFLLALTSGLSGLSSCKSILPGGHQAKNVELEYTYIDENGKPTKVKVQSDLINLSGIREVEEKQPKRSLYSYIDENGRPIKVKVQSEPSFYKVAAELRKPQVAFKPEPLVKTIYVPAQEPQVRYVVAPPAPKPQVRYVVAPPAPKPQVRYVVAPPVVTQSEIRYILQQDEPKVVELDTDDSEINFTVKQPEVRTFYVQAPAPVPAPAPEVKHVLPAHFVAATHMPMNLKTTFKHNVEESKDDEDFGSAEK